MEKLKLIVIDKEMTSCEIEVNANQFKSLGININNAKKHKRKRDLNITLSEYLERVNNEE